MDKMKLSIITINYNNLDGLRKTAESVIFQTWRNFEWIIIDGGSTDGSKEFIEDLSKNSRANMSYWCSEKDAGVYNAMNKGLIYANGYYVNFMNSGDVFYDFRTLEYIFKEDLWGDILYGDWINLYKDKTVLKTAYKDSFEFFVFVDNICHQAMFIRTDLHRKYMYDESYKILADWKLWRLLSTKGCKYQYLPYTICKFDAKEGISSTNFELLEIEGQRIEKEEELPYEFKKWTIQYKSEVAKIRFCTDSILGSNIYNLAKERKLYQYVIHAFVIFMKSLKKILDILHL